MKNKKTPKHHPPKYRHPEAMSQAVLKALGERPLQRHNPKQIAHFIGLKNHEEYVLLLELLDKLVNKGKILRIKRYAYQAVYDVREVIGKVDYVNSNFAFIIPEDNPELSAEDELAVPQADIVVYSARMNRALHGDRVKVRILPGRRGNHREGEVTEIIQRAKTQFVGRIQHTRVGAFVVPSEKRMFYDFYVPTDQAKDAQNGDKVVVELIRWTGGDRNPVGKVIEVLGQSGENNTEIHAIMFEYGLPFRFGEEVEAEANAIPDAIHPQEIARRRDFRGITTFTIDPLNAKDFDDALSIRQLGADRWEIGVHIADVTHYVRPGSLLEAEAQKRATSVYLVDRTVPMLPEHLSNGLCSLRPNEDKCTFSAVFVLDDKANIVEEWFGKTIIHSDRRFTYEEAQERIETGQGDFAAEIIRLNELALLLKAERFSHGAIAFESNEYYFELDPNGKPLRMTAKIRKDAHKLIEEFMLLANRRVAEYVHGLKNGRQLKTMIYRVHEEPDPEKVATFAQFVSRFGFKIEGEGKKLARSFNSISQAVEGKPEQFLISSQAVRAMAKARYTVQPLGHYGLAFRHYSHFTSPIRRYPDMMAHRLLEHYLSGGEQADAVAFEALCRHSSDMERRAAEAERASVRYKQVEFMQQFIGKTMPGIVSGVTDWGLYVELDDTHCEGMIRLSNMQDDRYYHDSEQQCIIGQRYRRTFRLGDKVQVIVAATNVDKRTIDFELI